MALTVQTASAAVTAAGTNGAGSASPLSATISPPSGLAAGDTWLIVAVDDWGSGSSWNTPSGFTKQSASWNDGAGQNIGVTLWYKPNCAGSETSVTLTQTVAGQTNLLFTGLSWRHSGAATGTPFVDISDGSATVAIAAGNASKAISSAAAHTPTAAGEVVYLITAQAAGETSSGGVTWSTPAGWTLLTVADHDTTAHGAGTLGGDFTSLACFYQVQTTATAVPVATSTATFPGNAFNNGGGLGAVISFYAAAASSDPFPAGYGVPYRANNVLMRVPTH